MIGSPASRGAVASLGDAGRGSLAAAPAVSAVSAAIAASVTIAAGPQRRIASVDCAVVNRFTMPCPVGMRVRVCVDRVSNRDVWITNSQHHTPPIRSWGPSHVRWAILSYTTASVRTKGGSLLKFAQSGHSNRCRQCPLWRYGRADAFRLPEAHRPGLLQIRTGFEVPQGSFR
jgi:hypothetical protein